MTERATKKKKQPRRVQAQQPTAITAAQRVAIAELEYQRAQVDQVAYERGELLKRLKVVRRSLAENRLKYQTQAAQIKAEDELVSRVQQHINALLSFLGQSSARKPAAAAYLAPEDDPEIADWAAQHRKIEDELAESIRVRDSIHRTDRLPVIQLGEGLNSEISRLAIEEQNILNRLNNSLGKLSEGGIFGVS